MLKQARTLTILLPGFSIKLAITFLWTARPLRPLMTAPTMVVHLCPLARVCKVYIVGLWEPPRTCPRRQAWLVTPLTLLFRVLILRASRDPVGLFIVGP